MHAKHPSCTHNHESPNAHAGAAPRYRLLPRQRPRPNSRDADQAQHERHRGRGAPLPFLASVRVCACARAHGARQNHYAFSPNPWFVAGFFSAQTVLQAWWLRTLWSMPEAQELESADDEDTRAATLAYVPIYALGNLCIGTHARPPRSRT